MTNPTVSSEIREVVKELAYTVYSLGFSHCQGVDVDGRPWNAPNPEGKYVEEALSKLEELIVEAREDELRLVMERLPKKQSKSKFRFGMWADEKKRLTDRDAEERRWGWNLAITEVKEQLKALQKGDK